MKKFLLLFSILFLVQDLSAQDYDFYLQNAYSALEKGKIEIAQSSYNVYKKMTGKTDLDFETLLKNDWTKSCHIIDINDEYSLAVQKEDEDHLVKLKYIQAYYRSHNNRLGGYNDWRLPGKDELMIILSVINFPMGYYWADPEIVGLMKRNVSINYGDMLDKDGNLLYTFTSSKFMAIDTSCDILNFEERTKDNGQIEYYINSIKHDQSSDKLMNYYLIVRPIKK